MITSTWTPCARWLSGSHILPSSVPKSSQAPDHQHTNRQRGQQQQRTQHISGCEGRDFFCPSLSAAPDVRYVICYGYVGWNWSSCVFGLALWNSRRVEHDGCQVPSLQEHGVLPQRHQFPIGKLVADWRGPRSPSTRYPLFSPPFLSPDLPAFSRASPLSRPMGSPSSPPPGSAGFVYHTPLLTNLLPVHLPFGASPVSCIAFQAQDC
ncbi:hypothetical protein B0T20DRAFT_12773 [Sordaria brevicollis]|uniref:Uncharacterized protein n=1 Tax=Sordaria brevicollis TaxID=83679 RepID=A0AAE0PNA1_SORBR|nr:hypothetical protein B0T20DRAFT_12773 [Sordaria brevicollis]